MQKRRLILWIALPVVLLAALVALPVSYRWKWDEARATWKTAALQRLATAATNQPGIAADFEQIRPEPDGSETDLWTGEHVLLMANGEYLIYEFWHGSNSGYPDHLFLARSSDGRWFYSTYHFCNGMAGVRSDDQPASLKAFAETCAAREFDGKSDQCLEHTWPEKR
jgi:hypothetical protein